MKVKYFDIANLEKWIVIKRIDKGWSREDKYYIKDQKGNQFLLRISEKTDLIDKENEYTAFQELNKKN